MSQTIQEIVAALQEKYKNPKGVDAAAYAKTIQEDARDHGVLADVFFPDPSVLVIAPRRLTPTEAVGILRELTDDENTHAAADQIILWTVPFEVQDAYNEVAYRNLEDWL